MCYTGVWRCSLRLQYKKLAPDAVPPIKGYADDAGFDLTCHASVQIGAHSKELVSCAIAVSIPAGFYGRLVPRSSAARRYGIVGIEGTIDCGYTGELFAYFYNPNDWPIEVVKGDRVCQLIITPLPYFIMEEVDELPRTERGARGFGSTGGTADMEQLTSKHVIDFASMQPRLPAWPTVQTEIGARTCDKCGGTGRGKSTTQNYGPVLLCSKCDGSGKLY